MKCKLLLCLALISSAFAVRAQTISVYENDGLVFAPPDIPPQIDATSFINANNGQFVINFTNNLLPGLFYGFGMLPYEMQNVVNYSNQYGAFMACNTGFRFEDFDPVLGRRVRSANFHNAGLINCGTTDTLNFFELDRSAFFAPNVYTLSLSVEGAKCTINADNIVNPGTIHMGFESYLDIRGNSVDLSYGTIKGDTQGFSLRNDTFTPALNGSIFDGYWGVGDVRSQFNPPLYPFGINPNQLFGTFPPFTHVHVVTTRNGGGLATTLGGPNFLSYLQINTDLSGTNVYTTAVFVANTNPAVKVNVYLQNFFGGFGGPAVPILEYTNVLGTSANNIYVEDLFGSTTNLQLLPNGISGGRVTAIPFNYIVQSLPPIFFFGTPSAATTIPPGTFPNTQVTNQYSAYQAILSPFSVLLSDLSGQNFTNIPGGMRITADNYLNLSNSEITSLNYLLLKSTNHFDLGTDCRISSPAVDMNLRSTNGLILVSNLFATTLARPEGVIDLFSARWTNTLVDPITGGITTNHFHVLFADGLFSPVSRSKGQDVILRATGSGPDDSIIIHDGLTVTHSMLLDAARITIATNDFGADPAAGSIFITDPRIVWPTAAPRLQYFTNNGAFDAQNAVFFGGSRSSPYYSSTFTEPYQVFVNTGTITNFASIIEANTFVNSGIVHARGGSITLTSTDTLLTNGAFITVTGAVSITTSSLIVSNHALVAGGGPITLSASYLLDDGTLAAGCPDNVTNKNIWICSGLNLPRLPSYATLLSTTVTNTAYNHNTVQNTWAGNDLGNTTAGFNPNNAPVGRLILDGRDPSTRFNFSGASANNALYVDYIELDNFATNYDAVNQRYTEVTFSPNMRVYFAQAVAGGVPVAEKLNGANGGRFVWVKDYNCGPFSSVLMTNPVDGTTYALNQAVRESAQLDSDSDGTLNFQDPTPVPLPVAACPCSSFIPPLLVAANPPSVAGSTNANSVSPSPQIDPPAPSGSGAATQTVAQNLGAYSGLFYETNGVNPASAGFVTANVTAKGGVSGKLTMGGKTYSFSGSFDAAGNTTVKIARGALHSLTLQLQLDLSGANQISGSVTDSRWSAQLLANRAAFDTKKNPASQFLGSYTLDIPGDAAASGRPSGDGFATVKVDAGGNVQVAGSLAEGSKLSLKAALSGSGSWPFYSSLYRGAGCALGWMQITNHNVAGRVVWIKPSGVAASTTKAYSAGFTNRIDTLGLRYQSPATGEALLNWNYGNLILSGGGLSASRTNLIFISDKNKLTISDDSSLKLTLTPSTGLFQGSILDSDTGKPLKFQGALLQDMNLGLGYFLNADQSGLIYLRPAQ